MSELTGRISDMLTWCGIVTSLCVQSLYRHYIRIITLSVGARVISRCALGYLRRLTHVDAVIMQVATSSRGASDHRRMRNGSGR